MKNESLLTKLQREARELFEDDFYVDEDGRVLCKIHNLPVTRREIIRHTNTLIANTLKQVSEEFNSR